MTTHTIGKREEQGPVPALGAHEWLCLAAAPSFAAMAVLTGVLHGGQQDMVCSAAGDAFPLNGMAGMYLLMSFFHAAPWLKLIFNRHATPG